MGSNVLSTAETKARPVFGSGFMVSIDGGDTAYRVAVRTVAEAQQTGAEALWDLLVATREETARDDYEDLVRDRIVVYTPEQWTAHVVADEAARRADLRASDPIVCACGYLHEADACPSVGHGVVL